MDVRHMIGAMVVLLLVTTTRLVADDDWLPAGPGNQPSHNRQLIGDEPVRHEPKHKSGLTSMFDSMIGGTRRLLGKTAGLFKFDFSSNSPEPEVASRYPRFNRSDFPIAASHHSKPKVKSRWPFGTLFRSRAPQQAVSPGSWITRPRP